MAKDKWVKVNAKMAKKDKLCRGTHGWGWYSLNQNGCYRPSIEKNAVWYNDRSERSER